MGDALWQILLHQNYMKTLTVIEITDNMICHHHKPDGWTPLILAATTGKVDAVRLFLKIASSATVNAIDNQHMTALMYAVANGRYDVVRVLMASGKTSPDIKNQFGKTAAEMALSKGNVLIALMISPYSILVPILLML